MPRPQRCRRICGMPRHLRFAPENGQCREAVVMTLDEYEAIRLMDHEGLTQEQCAEIMQVSRPTVTDIYAQARCKLSKALVEGRELFIEGGRVQVCDHSEQCGLGVCGRGEGADET